MYYFSLTLHMQKRTGRQDQGVPGVDAKKATIHATHHLENQNRGSTFTPPR